MSGLAGRLRRMKETATPRSFAKEKRDPDGKPMVLDRFLPGWDRIDDFLWSRSQSAPATLPVELDRSPLLPKGAKARDFIFLDVETTGLSGGAGTIAFLAGLGFVRGDRLIIEQHFLSDYPGEHQFIKYLSSKFEENAVFVSYNGKSFDTQILRTRFIMNGMNFVFRHQLDLLHPARRLWSCYLESCSLSSIEEHILGLQRELDIPGVEIPDRYFQFLDSGDPAPLEPVCAHHLQDIITLERLLLHMQDLVSNPQGRFADPYRLGRWLLETGFGGWESLLRKGLQDGSGRAGHLLGRQLKRLTDWRGAEEIWLSLYRTSGDLKAALELSKLYEHKFKDPTAALELVDEMVNAHADPGNERALPESNDRIKHRRERLLVKVRNSKLPSN